MGAYLICSSIVAQNTQLYKYFFDLSRANIVKFFCKVLNMFEYNCYSLNNFEIVEQCEKLSKDNNIANGGVLVFDDVVHLSDVLFCATKENKVVGFVCLKYYKCFKNSIYIEQIVVNKKFTRLGIGTKLINLSIEYAKSHSLDAIYANCRKTNTASQTLFKKCGFIKYKMSKSVYAELEIDESTMNNSYALRLYI